MPEDVFVFPLSYAQQRLWFMEQLRPSTALFNISTAVHWPMAVDPAVVEHSINQIVERHEALRTTFTVMDGQPVQVIAPSMRVPLSVVDLEQISPQETWIEVSRRAREEARRLFDLGTGPLI